MSPEDKYIWMVIFCWNCHYRTVQYVNDTNWDDMNYWCLICEKTRSTSESE